MSFLAPALLAALLAHRHPDHGAPGAAGAAHGLAVPVADVPAADPEPVRAPPRHPALAAAGAAHPGVRADRPGLRAPVLPGAGAPAAAAGGAREVVVLLDRSASMGYGGHWARAQDAARRVVRGLGPGDARPVVFFSTDVEVGARPTAGPAALVAAIDRARPGAGAHQLRPCAAGRGGPARIAPRRRTRDRAHLGLPEIRLGPGAGPAAARRRHAHDRLRRRGVDSQRGRRRRDARAAAGAERRAGDGSARVMNHAAQPVDGSRDRARGRRPPRGCHARLGGARHDVGTSTSRRSRSAAHGARHAPPGAATRCRPTTSSTPCVAGRRPCAGADPRERQPGAGRQPLPRPRPRRRPLRPASRRDCPPPTA